MAKILLVDDDELLVELVQITLEGRGFEVATAEDGEHALDLLRQDDFDLVVLDGMMPGIDGLDVLRTIRDDEQLAKVPVVMLSARRQQDDIVGGLSIGAEDYLIKPFMPEELVARIEKIINRSAA